MGGNFVEVVGYTTLYTLNSILVTSGIQSGKTYRLRYRAHNSQGWSEYSPIGEILAATIPGASSQPTTQVAGVNVVISWEQPLLTGGNNVPITKYEVEIRRVDGTFTQVCSVTGLSCFIPMETLLQSPYNFKQGDNLVARVTCSNVVGRGPTSALSSTIVAQV